MREEQKEEEEGGGGVARPSGKCTRTEGVVDLGGFAATGEMPPSGYEAQLIGWRALAAACVLLVLFDFCA